MKKDQFPSVVYYYINYLEITGRFFFLVNEDEQKCGCAITLDFGRSQGSEITQKSTE